MQSESELKKQFRTRAQKEPEKYYPVGILKEEGFSRIYVPKTLNTT
ncbi:MAG: hypothetical protein V3R93_00180 [Candidatus Hydrothermarchaeaceae archaeon]